MYKSNPLTNSTIFSRGGGNLIPVKNKNFYEGIAYNAEKSPEKVLLTVAEEQITYDEFMIHTKEIAKALRKSGVSCNDKVGMVISNSTRWYEIFWAAVRIGAQPVPMDPQSGKLELERLLQYADIRICFFTELYRGNHIAEHMKELRIQNSQITRFIFIDGGKKEHSYGFQLFQDFIEEGRQEKEEASYQPESGHVMSLACTSGSTGNPKILSVPYEGFYDAILDMSDYLGFTGQDLMMIGMPLYHQGGFGMGLQTVIKGGSVIYQPQFEPESFLKTIQERKVTIIQLTSTLAKILLSHPDFYQYDLSSVKVCYFAGEVLPKEVAAVFVEKFHIRVINVIGSSETATMVVWDSDKDYDVDPSDFKPLPFTQVCVIDEDGNETELGELEVYTTAVIYNYYGNEEETKSRVVIKNGKRCFRTGDLVKRLPDGRIRFVGRKKRIIKRGANLVHAEEVEGFLLMHPRIEAVAVTAQDHEVIGQEIVAYVQTSDNRPITRIEIAKYFKGKLSAYKIPDRIVMTDDLPHDIGKIQFKYIREQQRKEH